MVVDTSALFAILEREPESAALIALIAAAERPLISAVSVLEAGFVAEGRRGLAGAEALDRLLREARLEVVPVDGAQAAVARMAFRRFGKGRHPAGLNICDCAAYALAATSGEPLLFKGADFARTDVPAALPA